MSKLLANQISNYNDNGPVEVKDGVNIPTGKPFEVAGSAGTSGQFLKSTGSSVAWEDFPAIPAGQVQSDWNATAGLGVILNKPSLATVATSGSYTDLTNQPTIPQAQVNSDWTATTGVEQILNKPVLFSGAYSDLTGRPSIPATITDLAGVNLPSPIPDGSYIQWDTATSKWVVGTGSSGILDVLEDTTPQLGGPLDVNGFYIDMGSNNITDQRVTEWNSAYNWGNHASAGYLTSFTNTTYAQACVADGAGVKIRLSDSFGVQDDVLVTAGTGITIDQIGTEGFRINSTATGGGGGASVTVNDNPPGTAGPGDLWWKSDEGRLKVQYNDGSGSQWVDASPPLSPSFTPRVSNQTVELEAFHNSGSGTWSQHYLKMTGHLLPSAHETYDIGSAEKKIRHLFLSDNSLWLGDDIKMSNKQGKVKFHTRDTNKLPKAISDAGGSFSGLDTFISNQFPGRSGTPDKTNSQGAGYFITDFVAYLASLTDVPETSLGPNDLWPPETVNGAANPNYDLTDWSNSKDLTQDGKSVANTLSDDAQEYKLWEATHFLRTSVLADFPVKVVGSSATDGTYIDMTIFVPQGNTPRTMTTLSIDGVDATQATITGTTEANTTNTFTIKAIYFGGEWKATVAIG